MIACPIIARRTTLPINPPIRKFIVHTASVPPRSNPLGTIQTHIFPLPILDTKRSQHCKQYNNHQCWNNNFFYHISHVPLSSIHIVINLCLIIAVYRCRGIIQGSQKICFNVSNLGRISIQTKQHIFDM